MDVELQFTIMFCLSIVFTVIYMKRESITPALFSMLCWWILAYYWLISSPAVYGVSFLFFLFGFVMFIYFFRGTLELFNERKDKYDPR